MYAQHLASASALILGSHTNQPLQGTALIEEGGGGCIVCAAYTAKMFGRGSAVAFHLLCYLLWSRNCKYIDNEDDDTDDEDDHINNEDDHKDDPDVFNQ